jgi:serine/threonine-protein kinase Chk1
MMLAAAPPFENSSPNDPHYKLIREKKYETFWHSHSKKKPAGFFSTSFKELVQRMIAFNPKERPTLSEIMKHEWVLEEPPCSHEQMVAEFTDRQKKLAQILEDKRTQQEEERKRRKDSIHNQGYANRDA